VNARNDALGVRIDLLFVASPKNEPEIHGGARNPA
jgi:hypothetical protein